VASEKEGGSARHQKRREEAGVAGDESREDGAGKGGGESRIRTLVRVAKRRMVDG